MKKLVIKVRKLFIYFVQFGEPLKNISLVGEENCIHIKL